jgi:hypothetical protein
MKKLILLAVVLLVAGSVSAQTYFNGDKADFNTFYQPSWGFELGAAISNATNSPNFNTGSLTGFNAGFTVDLPVAYPLSIMPEIQYTQKGYTANTQSGDFTQRTQFLDVPILAKFRSGNAFNFYVGPQVSYLVAAASSFSNGFSATSRENYQYTGSKILYDGVIGVGVNITNSIDLHAKYAFDLEGTNSNGNNVMPAYRNEVWQVGLGFRIN